MRRDWTVNGHDSIEYAGITGRVVTNTNAAEGNIWGYNFALRSQISDRVAVDASYNFTFGEDLTDNVPLGHIPPIFGRVGVQFTTKRWYNSIYSLFNGHKPIEDFAPSGVDNELETTVDGTPAWYTINYRTSFAINDHLTVQGAIENILDHHYKPFASRCEWSWSKFRDHPTRESLRNSYLHRLFPTCTMTKFAYPTLQKLVSIHSPSGFTNDACKYIHELLSSYGFQPEFTNKGAVKCALGPNPTLAIAAHVDTLGAIVSGIEEDGRLRFRAWVAWD